MNPTFSWNTQHEYKEQTYHFPLHRGFLYIWRLNMSFPLQFPFLMVKKLTIIPQQDSIQAFMLCPRSRFCCCLGFAEASNQFPHWRWKLEASPKPQGLKQQSQEVYITRIAVLSLICSHTFNQSVPAAAVFHIKSQKPTFQPEELNTRKTH